LETATSKSVLFHRRFIVIEGPNGTGKTTITAALAERLRRHQQPPIEVTREPSDTALGMAIRQLESSMPPLALALACAADRHDHLTRTIDPALAAGAMVLCDRFLPSSLVLQRLDGLSLEEIWQLNNGARTPDMVIYLEASPETLKERLEKRQRHSRFEESTPSEVEIAYYRDARAFLAQRGWPGVGVATDGCNPDEVASEIELQLGA
jgi:dTMP kinase